MSGKTQCEVFDFCGLVFLNNTKFIVKNTIATNL